VLGIGAKASDSTNNVWDLAELLIPIIGEPSATDVLKIIQTSEGQLDLERLSNYGCDAYSFGISPNIKSLEAKKFDRKWLEQNKISLNENWRHYIVDVNENSSCKSVSKERYHWADKKLSSWYTEKLNAGHSLIEIDKSLSSISRVYVERARSFILRGDIRLVASESATENKDIIKIIELIDKGDWNAAEDCVGRLHSKESLVSLTNSMIMR
jgi:hypothetical protein